MRATRGLAALVAGGRFHDSAPAPPQSPLSVQLFGNRSVALDADEQQLVVAEQPMGLCREVILHGDHGPAVLGWTLFAEAALQESGLRELGEQPWANVSSVTSLPGAITCNWPVSRLRAIPGVRPAPSGDVVPVCFWGNGHWSMNSSCPLSCNKELE